MNGKDVFSSLPYDLRTRFEEISRGIYPEDVIKTLKQSGYNPIMLGDDHTVEGLPSIKTVFTYFRQSIPKPTKVALEIIPPVQLDHIKKFRQYDEELKQQGTLYGKPPVQQQLDYHKSYRKNLLTHHAEHVALWLFENGFDVIPIEHDDVQKWIEEDRRYGFEEEETFGHTQESVHRSALTAIRRDIHGIQVMGTECPDLVFVGTAHALKYDFLLGRDGTRSHYFNTPINWYNLFDMWELAHNLYKSRKGIK